VAVVQQDIPCKLFLSLFPIHFVPFWFCLYFFFWSFIFPPLIVTTSYYLIYSSFTSVYSIFLSFLHFVFFSFLLSPVCCPLVLQLRASVCLSQPRSHCSRPGQEPASSSEQASCRSALASSSLYSGGFVDRRSAPSGGHSILYGSRDTLQLRIHKRHPTDPSLSFVFIHDRTLPWRNQRQTCKAIPVTGSEGLMQSRVSHTFLHNGLTDGGEVVSLQRRPPFIPRKFPGTHVLYRLSRTKCHSAAGRMRSTVKSSDLIGNRICDLWACSIVPQQTALPRAPQNYTCYTTLYRLPCIPLHKRHIGRRGFPSSLPVTISSLLTCQLPC
jgi:hypothetical protein